MAFNNFSFDPPDGFADTLFYEDTPSDSRAVLQRQHDQTRDFINSLVSRLNCEEEGASGSESIASPSIDGVSGTNVFDQLKDIKRQLTEASAGTIPDGSVSSAKLAAKSVTDAKIDDAAVGTNHFKENAVAPLSADTQKLNGIASAAYEPVETAGGIASFKERVSPVRFSTLRGATGGGYRYTVNYSGTVSRISLFDFTVEEVADLSSYSADPVITFAPDGTMYAAYIYEKTGQYYFRLLRYSDGEFVSDADVFLFSKAGNYSSHLLGIDIYDGKLYVYARYVSSKDYIYIWRVDLSDADDGSLYDRIASLIAGSKAIYPFIYEGDLYAGPLRLENCDPESEAEQEYNYIFPVPGKGFISDDDTFFFIGEDHLPRAVSSIPQTPSPSNAFCHGKYLYMLFKNYIFRARIY